MHAWCRLRLNSLARYWIVLGILILAGLATVTGTAQAAQMGGGETYRLPAGEVIQDDLYVAGGEIIIDGTVDGDLIAAGGYIEVNGVVTGDAILAGGGIRVTGVIQDDARLAGGGIVISGDVGDDLLVAGGGGPGMFVFPTGPRQVAQGVQLLGSATVGGDAFIVGGQGALAGSVAGDLTAGMGAIDFSGRVAGNASLNANTLRVNPASQVEGVLRYSTPQAEEIPAGVAAAVEYEAPATREETPPGRNPFLGFLGWLFRTFLILLGLWLLAWILLRLAPHSLTGPAEALAAQPVEAGIYGVLAAAAVLPVAAGLAFLAGLFWGWFSGGLVVLAFLLGLAALLWLLSPLVTGLWLGRQLAPYVGLPAGESLLALALGVAVIVLVSRVLGAVPCVGVLVAGTIYLLSFALAVGGLFLSWRGQRGQATPLPEPAP